MHRRGFAAALLREGARRLAIAGMTRRSSASTSRIPVPRRCTVLWGSNRTASCVGTNVPDRAKNNATHLGLDMHKDHRGGPPSPSETVYDERTIPNTPEALSKLVPDCSTQAPGGLLRVRSDRLRDSPPG